MEEFEAAEASLGKAQQYGATLIKELEQPIVPDDHFCDFAERFLEVLIDRARNAWKLQQQVQSMAIPFRTLPTPYMPCLPQPDTFM
jgi:hypothetical protein